MAQTDKIGRAGEHYVAAELNRRGAYASPFSGNVPGIDIVATDDGLERRAYIQVKTKRFANQRWAVSLRHGWHIDKDVTCLSLWDTCEPAQCAEAEIKPRSSHPHHDGKVTKLSCLAKVQSKPDHYWVFVSLEEMQYWIVPDAKVRDHLIRQRCIDYLKQRGGHRPGSRHDSVDFSIYEESYLDQWRGNWDVLGLKLENTPIPAIDRESAEVG